MKDYYYILGVTSHASKEEIKQAYRKLSLKFHPGQNNGDKFWEEKFTEINEAYETLIDNEERKKYDEKLAGQSTENTNAYSQSANTAFNKSPESKAVPIQKNVASKKKKTITWTTIIALLFIISQIYRFVAANEERKKVKAVTDAYIMSQKSPDSSAQYELLPPSTTPVIPKDTASGTDGNADLTILPSDLKKVVKVEFTTGIKQYRCALLLGPDNNTGVMRVKFFAGNQTNMIEETMKFTHTDHGDCLAGSNPTFITQPDTLKYYADNLFISQDVNGNVVLTNKDDIGHSDVCTVTELEDYAEKNKFLAEFNWKLADDVK